jgi:hypothetical protein
MVFSAVLQRFVDQTPICVMVRAILENQLSDARLDEIFACQAQRQYTKELAFSTCARLLCQVTLGRAASVHAAWKKDQATIPVSIVSIYEKLKHTEPGVCASLVSDTCRAAADVLRQLRGERRDPIPGYRLRVLDGNVLAGTEHRLKELRFSGAAALPGRTLALYDYRTDMVHELVPCENAHTSERKLLPQVLPLVAAGDLLLADANFATIDFLNGIVDRRAEFLIRHHGSLKLQALERQRKIGRCSTGMVFEQRVRLSNGMVCRAIVIHRDKPLQKGGKLVTLLTSVPRSRASAAKLAEVYLKRWTIEEVFRQLTEYLSCEVRTLGYPKAALLAFTLAVLGYNCLSVVRAALAHVHGRARVDKELSNYYLGEEVRTVYEGMAVAVPAKEWQVFARMDAKELGQTLTFLAKKMDWQRYTKNPRGPKKPVKRRKVKRGYHVATAQLLEGRKKRKPRKRRRARAAA